MDGILATGAPGYYDSQPAILQGMPTLPDGRTDMTNQYNTALSPGDEARFQKWLSDNDRQSDLADYDMRGWFKENGTQASNGHFTDQYKKPNHPTFSVESQYNGVDGYNGGTWGGDDKNPTFAPSQTNLANMKVEALRDYFKRVEPDAQLIMGQQ
jgi:hypothetical protein